LTLRKLREAWEKLRGKLRAAWGNLWGKLQAAWGKWRVRRVRRVGKLW